MSGEAQNVGVAPLCAHGLRVESARRRRVSGVGGGSDGRHARLWRRRGRAGRLCTSHSPPVSRGSPRTSRSPSPYGTKRRCRSGPVGRGGPLIMGGGVGRLRSFLAASRWRSRRGASHGRTTNPLCLRFTWGSPQRRLWAVFGTRSGSDLGRARYDQIKFDAFGAPESRVGWVPVLSSQKLVNFTAYELEIEGPRRRPCEARRAPERASTFAPTPRAKPRSRVSA